MISSQEPLSRAMKKRTFSLGLRAERILIRIGRAKCDMKIDILEFAQKVLP